jgi:hypothetical protein
MTIGDERLNVSETQFENLTPEEKRATPMPAATPDSSQMTSSPNSPKSQSEQVAGTAVEGGREVVSEISGQASAVAGTAKDHVNTLIGQAKDELATQGEARGQQLVSGLQTLADQLSALLQGRPDEAGQLRTMVDDAQQRVQSYAGSLQQRGPRALVDDVSAFARRRPGAFLLGASITGFAIGRLVRSGAASNGGNTAMSSTPRSTFEASRGRTWTDGAGAGIGGTMDTAAAPDMGNRLPDPIVGVSAP